MASLALHDAAVVSGAAVAARPFLFQRFTIDGRRGAAAAHVLPEGAAVIAARRALASGVARVHAAAAQAPPLCAALPPEQLARVVFHLPSGAAAPAAVAALPAACRCVAVAAPNSDFAARLLFRQDLGAATAAADGAIAAALDRALDVIGCIPSAVTCPVQRAAVQPRHVVEQTERLLQMGCAAVLWDDSGAGGKPRAVENLCKTAMAAGVAVPGRIILALRSGDEQLATACAYRALEMGVTDFVACAGAPRASQSPLAPGCFGHGLVPPHELLAWAASLVEQGASASDAALEEASAAIGLLHEHSKLVAAALTR
jgi:hypothetical protein